MSALRLWSPDGDESNPASSVPPLRSAAPTVKAVIDWFIEHNPRPSKSPVADIERHRIWGLFVSEHGAKLVAACRGFQLAEFIASQVNVHSNWTRRRWNVTIQKPFNHAAKLGLIDRNPFTGVSYPDGKEGRDWTDAEFRAMLRATTPCFRRVLVCVRFSGMRPGEVRETEWTDIRDSLRAFVLDGEKTKTKVARRIPFNHVTLKLVAWLRRKSRGKCSHVFLNSHNEPWTIGAFVKRIIRLRDVAGLGADVKLHGGRHSFATTAILNGIDPATLAELLGHKHISTTQKYVHLANKTDHLEAAMERAVGKRVF